MTNFEGEMPRDSGWFLLIITTSLISCFYNMIGSMPCKFTSTVSDESYQCEPMYYLFSITNGILFLRIAY
ncbi:hypothetical protein BX666DRAFT_1948665 [Dichotomocladium elegans]|nr:hypothetical protein BX666DRAFT_1948665 [Dichotomocladium elegans]